MARNSCRVSPKNLTPTAFHHYYCLRLTWVCPRWKTAEPWSGAYMFTWQLIGRRSVNCLPSHLSDTIIYRVDSLSDTIVYRVESLSDTIIHRVDSWDRHIINYKTRKASCRWQTCATLAKRLHGLRNSSRVLSCIASLPIDSLPMVSY